MLTPRTGVVCALLLLAAALGSGQTFNGTILGTVQDTSQAVITDARINVVETNTGLQRATVSNKLGYFELPSLPPGTYRVEADQPGFKKFVRSGLN